MSILEWVLDQIQHFSPLAAYLSVFLVLLACGIGIPIPEDITLIVGGVFCYYGVTNIYFMVIVGLAGVLVGDSTMYWLGHHYGMRLTKRWPFKQFLDDEKLKDYALKFQKQGGKVLFAARFMPGVRSGIFFTAGTLNVPYWKLLAYNGSAALLSVPAIVVSVFLLGDNLEKIVKTIKHVESLVLTGIVLIILGMFWRRWKKKRTAAKAV